MSRQLLAALALAAVTAACSDSAGPSDGARVALRFATIVPASASVVGAAADELVLDGTNGRLVIQDIQFVVAEFELEQQDGACAGAQDDDAGADCEDIELGPVLVDLPLGAGSVTLGADMIAPGTYRKFEFEVESLEDHADDSPREQQAGQAILARLRQTYPDFPRRASIVVRGTFTPTGGAAEPFVVYVDAEVEMEMDLEPPVTIPGAQALTVTVEPARWFTDGDRVLDLAALDGTTIELEPEVASGFRGVERDD